MNKKSMSAPKLLFISCIAVSAAAVIFRILLSATVLEPNKHGLYKAGSVLPTVFHVFLALAIVALVFISVKMTAKKADSFTLRTMPSNIILGVFLLTDALGIILNILTKKIERNTFITLELEEEEKSESVFTAALVTWLARGFLAVAIAILSATVILIWNRRRE